MVFVLWGLNLPSQQERIGKQRTPAFTGIDSMMGDHGETVLLSGLLHPPAAATTPATVANNLEKQ